MQDTIVLGAGIVGVSIAYHLAERGQEVVLVDRKPPGSETSFGNAGMIQREAVEPHPFPRDLADIFRVLSNRSIDIRYSTLAMISETGPLLKYWHYSAPDIFARIVTEYAALIMHCTAEHETMARAANAESLIRKDGWLEVFRNYDVFETEQRRAEEIRNRFGVEHKVLDGDGLAGLEPHVSHELIGAIHWTNSWSAVDPGALVQAYARTFEAQGGEFHQAEATRLTPASRGWRLETQEGQLEGRNLVLATGPWSNKWLAELGYHLPLFHMRGYHMHYDAQPATSLNYACMDFEKGYFLSPKRTGLRLTTGAELDTLDAPAHSGQLDAAEAEARTVFPLGARRDAEPWKGARPCMADMKPVIGPAPNHANLWLAFGHAHQGFTLGPLTGRLIGEMMAGETPLVDMAPYRADRF